MGVILADITRHISNAIQEEYGDDSRLISRAIIKSYLKELGDPTSDVKGGFIDND